MKVLTSFICQEKDQPVIPSVDISGCEMLQIELDRNRKILYVHINSITILKLDQIPVTEIDITVDNEYILLSGLVRPDGISKLNETDQVTIPKT